MPIRSFVATFAGAAGTSGSTNATGASARFNSPAGMACDLSGNVFVIDSANHLIRRITSAGVVSTFAGSGSSGSTNGTGTAASFNAPFGIAIDSARNLYVADTGNNMIRRITSQGVVTTFAGATTSGSSDGVGTAALFNGPCGIAVDSNDIVYVADTLNNKIRRIAADGTVTTFAGPAAGTTTSGNTNGTGTAARFNSPYSITCDGANNLFVADYNNNVIREVTPAGVVTTFAGSGSAGDISSTIQKWDKSVTNASSLQLNAPWSVAMDKKDGVLYIAEYGNNKIKAITIATKMVIFAGPPEGNTSSGSADGVDLCSSFNRPHGIAVTDNGIVYISDNENHTIRRIANTAAQVGVFAGPGDGVSTTGTTDGTVSSALFSSVTNAAFDSTGNMYVVDATNKLVRRITQNGVVTTFAGASNFTTPYGIAVDYNDDVYVSDEGANNIKKITSGGSVSIFCSGLSTPKGICFDTANTLYVANFGNNRILRVDNNGSVANFAGSAIASSVDGNGLSATFNGPIGIAIDYAKNAYVTEVAGHKIRKITGVGVVTTLAGSGSAGDANGTGSAATFNMPNGIAVDNDLNVYVADSGNNKIRRISPAGVVTTYAGPSAGTTTAGDVSGVGTAARFTAEAGLVLDDRNNLYVMDANKIKLIATSTTNNVRPYAPSYASTAFVSKSSSESIYHPTVDSNGNVWAANWASPTSIVKFDAAGTILLEINTDKVYNLAVDSSNNVYAFTGTNIIKYNGATGAQLWSIAVPVIANHGYIFTSPNYLYLYCNCSNGIQTAGTDASGATVTFSSTQNGYNIIKFNFSGNVVSVLTSPSGFGNITWVPQRSVDAEYSDQTNYWNHSLVNSYSMGYVDSSDNMYVRFKTSVDNIDFGNGVISHGDNLDLSLIPAGSPTTWRDVIVKYDSSGVAQWTKEVRFRPENSSWLGLTTMAFDADMNIYVGGFTYPSVPRVVTSGARPTRDQFDFRINLTNDYRYYLGFLLKYDRNGNHIWSQAERMYGVVNSEQSSIPNFIDIDDANGVMYVGGSTALKGNHYVRLGFNDKLSMSFSDDPDTTNTGPNFAGSKGYVAQYDLNGNCHWINAVRDNNKVGWGYDRTGTHAVFYRNSKLYFTGQFKLNSATGTSGVFMTDMKIIDTNDSAVQSLVPTNSNKSLYTIVYNLLPPVVPDPPTGVTAIAKNTSAIVSWTAPAFNGRSRITGYIVTPSSGSPVNVDGATLSTTITGLTNGTAYTFTVRATNAVGNSSLSTASNSVTPANQPPEAPTSVVATVTGAAAQAVVTWTAPSDNGGRPVTSYTISSSPSSTAVTVTATDASGSVVTTGTVTGLTNGTSYTFTVTATNSVGTSSASTASSSVIPYTVPDAPTSVSETFDPSALSGASLWLDASDAATLTLANTNELTAWANKISGGTNATVRLGSSFSNTWVSPTVISNGLNGKSYLNLTAMDSIEVANNYNDAAVTFLIVAKILPGNDTTRESALLSTMDTNQNGRGFGIRNNVYRIYSYNSTSTTAASYTTNDWVILSVRYNTTSSASFRLNGINYSVSVGTSTPFNSTGLKIGIGSPQIVGDTPSTRCQIAEVFAYTSYLNDVDIVRLETYVAEKWNLWGYYTNYVPSVRGGSRIANLYWNTPAFDGGNAITNYTINSTPAINTITQTGTNVVVSGLTNGTSYLFDIKANNARGGSSSLNYTVVPAAIAPSAPRSVTASVTAAANRATVTWLAPTSDGDSSITSYTVTSEPGGFTATTADGLTLTADVTGLTNGVAYIFRVAATNAVGTSSASLASAAVIPYIVPDAPTPGTATPSNASCALSWSAPADNGGSAITGYRITANPVITPIILGNVTSTNITGLTNGIEYTFSVQASNARGFSAPASFTAATPAPILPSAPRSVTTNVAAAGSGEVIVSWLAPLDDGGAPITEYTVTSSSGEFTAQIDGETLSTIVSGLTNGISYTFTVVATNSVGNSPASTASAATIPYTVPDVPTIVSVTATNTAATLTWSAPASNGGNAITTYTLSSSPASTTITTASTTATVTGLTNGITYTFTVRANNARGASAGANFAAVTPAPIAPSAPRSVTTTIVGSTATVSWLAPVSNGGATITGYTVTSYPSIGSPVTVNGTTLTANVTGLAEGTEYTFAVFATNSVGNSSEANTAPAPITFSTATYTTPSTLTMTWTKPAGLAVQNYTIAAGFNALYSLDSIQNSSNIEYALDDRNLGAVGSAVTTWANATGNSLYDWNNSVLSSGGTVVSVAGTSAKAVRFNGSYGSGLTQKTTWSPSITTYTVTIVARSVNGSTSRILDDTNDNLLFGWWANNVNVYYSGNWQMLPGYANNQSIVTQNNNNTNWRIYTFRLTGTSFSITVGGVKHSYTTSGTTGLNRLAMGGRWESTNCDVAALYVWKNRILSDTEVTSYEYQLAQKYNVPLSTWFSAGLNTDFGFSVSSIVAHPSTFVNLNIGLAKLPTISGFATNSNVNSDTTIVKVNVPNITSTATILNLPTRPIPSTITTSNAHATLRWLPPASDGGSAITNYTLTSQPVFSTITTASTIFTYTGLTNDTPYTFFVRANNAVGNSQEAAWDVVIPRPDPASAPSSITVVAGNTMANVAWLPPASNGGGTISSYMIVASPGGATTSVLGNLSSATLTGLANGSNYTLALTAVNSVGNGAVASAAVTPVEFLADSNTIFYYTFQNPDDTTAASAFTDSSAANSTLPHTSTTGGTIEIVGGRQGYRTTIATSAPSMLVRSVANVVNLTYAFNIYLESAAATNSGILFSRGNSTTSPTGIRITGQTLSYTHLNTAAQSSVTVDYGTWTHIALVVTPTRAFWYKNGTLAQSVAASYGTIANLGEFAIGYDSTSFLTTKLPGLLQNVTFMRRALSAPEVALLYSYADAVPAPPTNITVAPTGFATTVGFAPASTLFGFQNTYSLTSIPAVSTFYTTLSSLRYYTLELGSNYTYVLRTFNKLGASSNALSQTFTSPASNTPISPNEPRNVLARATNANAATVTWEAPDFDGGSGLSYYTALATPGDISTIVDGSTRVANFSSLLSTATYTLTVKAGNTAGESQESVPATLNMTTVPGAPSMRFAYRASVSTANVYWNAPAGPSVSSYTVTANHGDATVTTPASNLYSIVSNLTSNVNYSFTVVANNASGTGPSSAASGAVGFTAGPTVISTLNADGTSIFVRWNPV
jgi:sugar lactone lactonase YvrE